MQEKTFYKGGTDWTCQPVQDRGQQACWKAAGSAGRRVPLLSPSLVSSGRHLVPGGKKTQGARKPSAVLSADVCLSVCLSSALRVCVCAGIVSGLVLFWCIIL